MAHSVVNVANSVIIRKLITSPGTAEQMAEHAIPDGMEVIVTARPTNTGNMYVAFTAAAAESSSGAREVFGFGRSAGYRIDNLNRLFVDADNGTDVLEFRVPKEK